MFNMLLIRGEEHDSLPNNLEASECYYGALSEVVFKIVNSYFRDAYMLDMDNRGQSSFQTHIRLKDWQDVLDNATL